MTQESREVAIVDPGASYEADLEADRLEGPNLMPAELRVTAVPEPGVGPTQFQTHRRLARASRNERVSLVSDPLCQHG